MRVYTDEERPKTTMDMTDTAMMPLTTTRSKVEEAGRLPSIEMEPRTLTLDQIKNAREAALFVVSTKTEEEAIRIFTAGLKPVQPNSNNVRKSGSFDSSDDDVDLDGSTCNTSGGGGGRSASKLGGRRGRRRHYSSMLDDDIRDVATAPF